jgi:paraquat-inducible protein A
MASSFHIATTTVHECPDCGLFNRLPVSAKPGTDIRCGRCAKILRRVRRDPVHAATACAAAALFFYIVALTTPYLQAWLYDSFQLGSLTSGPIALDNSGFWPLATVVLLFTVVMPLVKVLGLLTVFIELRRENPPRWIATFFGWLKHLNTWSMIEVYLLGFIVAYTRLQAIMQVQIDTATIALVGLMLAMAGIDATLDPEAVWNEMRRKKVVSDPPGNLDGHLIGCDVCHEVCCAASGEKCPRCGAPLHERKPNSLSRGWALTIAAALLYIPSNYFPVMTVMKFGRYQSYTIFAGLEEFVKIGMWPLAVLVFTASIAIPLFKLLSLTYMLTETHLRSKRLLKKRTQLYRVIEFIGRWSMVDIFMVSILVALVHFGAFAGIRAEEGAVYFASIVILTMLAVEAFDPRLMWDAARMHRAGHAVTDSAGKVRA